MEHLTGEMLARLVDEPAAPAEESHLVRCERCAAELAALRAQTRDLRSLPELEPPGEGWTGLRDRLRAEGLLRRSSEAGRETGPGAGSWRTGGLPGTAGAPRWRQVAAAACIFFVGAASGGWAASGREAPGGGEPVIASVAPEAASELSLDETEALLAEVQEVYLEALTLYRDRLEEEEGTVHGDPMGRFAALDRLLHATEEAVREAPADPFLNGLLVSTIAEREATLRGMAGAPAGVWY